MVSAKTFLYIGVAIAGLYALKFAPVLAQKTGSYIGGAVGSTLGGGIVSFLNSFGATLTAPFSTLGQAFNDLLGGFASTELAGQMPAPQMVNQNMGMAPPQSPIVTSVTGVLGGKLEYFNISSILGQTTLRGRPIKGTLSQQLASRGQLFGGVLETRAGGRREIVGSSALFQRLSSNIRK